MIWKRRPTRTWWGAFPPFFPDHSILLRQMANIRLGRYFRFFFQPLNDRFFSSLTLWDFSVFQSSTHQEKSKNTLLRFSSSLRWSNSFNLFIQLCLDTIIFLLHFFLLISPSHRARSVGKSVVNPWRVWVKLRKTSTRSSAFLHPHSGESHGRLLLPPSSSILYNNTEFSLACVVCRWSRTTLESRFSLRHECYI